jgi:hypothetical protein
VVQRNEMATAGQGNGIVEGQDIAVNL